MHTRLTRIRLTNFRQFRTLDLEFHPRLTVLLAPNGQGKTSVVQAIATALLAWPASLDQGQFAGVDRQDVRQVKDSDGQMVEIFPCEIHADAILLDSPVSWRVARSLKKNTKDFKGLLTRGAWLRLELAGVADERRATTLSLPLLASYSTGRIWSMENADLPERDDATRMLGYFDAMSSGASFGFLDAWMRKLTLGMLNKSMTGASPEDERIKLEVVQSALARTMRETGWTRIVWNGQTCAVHDAHGALPVTALSDGLKNVLAITADIAHRCVRLNPHLGARAAQETPGIVVIDEVDMHLHPSWQQDILAAFCEVFPQVQFIVTTHSPQVVTTVPAASIRILQVDDTGEGVALQPTRSPLAADANTALADIFDVPPRPPLPVLDHLHRLEQLVRAGQEDSPEADALRRRITEAGVEIPEADLHLWRFLAGTT